ncbi:arginase family protein [Streptomyces winkii]|uniref:arginase family protein n=1 Tax=Streptomyces winkii TaxID=3051178 RepID=UPI0028D646D6|nr:arginase family protein [Streptomyces sp. DSM 40971]
MRVLGVPFNSSGLPDGVARAPRALREAGLVSRLRAGRPDGGVHDAGDVDVGVLSPERHALSGLRALRGLETTTGSVRRGVADALDAGERPLVVGGDCPVLLGCLSGARDVAGETGLLFVDGHEDAWAPDLSTTGEAADCELGLLLGLNRGKLPRSLVRLLPEVDPSAVVALGPRDAGELAAHRIPSLAGHILMRTPDELHSSPDAPGTYAREATDRILSRVDSWWLHIDLDVLSTEALPAVDYPQPGGLTWPELELLASTALRAPGCVGITLCIYNPDLDPGLHHAGRIVRHLSRMCGSDGQRRGQDACGARRKRGTAQGGRQAGRDPPRFTRRAA